MRVLGWVLLIGAMSACQGSGSGNVPEDRPVEQGSAALTAKDAGAGRIHAAQRRLDAGVPDAGPFRPKLEGVTPPAPGECPAGQYRCCDGSCSPEKLCPQIACGAAPAMRE